MTCRITESTLRSWAGKGRTVELYIPSFDGNGFELWTRGKIKHFEGVGYMVRRLKDMTWEPIEHDDMVCLYRRGSLGAGALRPVYLLKHVRIKQKICGQTYAQTSK